MKTSSSAQKLNSAVQERTPVAEFKNGFTLKQVEKYRSNWDLPHLLSGGDASVWLSLRASESLPTAVLPVRTETMPLVQSLDSKIGKITAETKNFGNISLDEFMTHPQSYAQAFIVMHKGEVIYETYPAMKSSDSHLWNSVTKPLSSLIIDLLINEGKIDDQKTIGHYMPKFRESAWENIKIVDVLDMTSGLNVEENDETRADPDSIAIRLFNAGFGVPYKGKHEVVAEVLKSAKVVGEPGTKFEYASANPQMLALLAEAVTGESWQQLIDKKVWSKVGAEDPLKIHLSPEGLAGSYGLVSSQLRDLARFGMLYTPSWNKIATEQVVTPDILERIRGNVRTKDFYRNGYDGPVFLSRLNDDTMISNSRQWDAVWPDGDMWKAGVQSQGLYVSAERDLVIAFFSTNVPDDSVHRFIRPIATSGLFDD